MENEAIKLLVLDVDGTLTDGKIYMGPSGEMMKAFDIKDGYGIYHILPQHGITPVVITGRTSQITAARCKELNIQWYFQGVKDKQMVMQQLFMQLEEKQGQTYTWQNVAYVGDDLIDFDCMKMSGVCVCPADAVEEVKKIAHYVAGKNGGQGAVREIIEWLVR